MRNVATKRLACAIAILWALDSAAPLRAQIGVGTWVRPSETSADGGLTMTVEACCNGGRRLIYRVIGSDNVIMTVESPMDGTDVPVLVAGKPTGETMGIKRLDDRHTVAVLKMNGKTFGTSTAVLSADGKTLVVENDITSAVGGQAGGKQKETWVRK